MQSLLMLGALVVSSPTAVPCSFDTPAFSYRVDVPIPGRKPLDIQFEGWPMRVDAQQKGVVLSSTARLRFQIPLAFSDLKFHTKLATGVDGLLEVPELAQVAIRGTKERSALVSVASEPAIEFSVPCDALAVADADVLLSAHGVPPPDNVDRVYAKKRVLKVRAGKNRGDSVTVRWQRERWRALLLIESSGRWTKVGLDLKFGHGDSDRLGKLRGWVKTREVGAKEPKISDDDPGFGARGSGLGGGGCPATDEVTLRKGGKLYDRKGGFPWAEATEEIEVEIVARGSGPSDTEEWARLSKFPGIREGGEPCSPERLWVRRSDLMPRRRGD